MAETNPAGGLSAADPANARNARCGGFAEDDEDNQGNPRMHFHREIYRPYWTLGLVLAWADAPASANRMPFVISDPRW